MIFYVKIKGKLKVTSYMIFSKFLHSRSCLLLAGMSVLMNAAKPPPCISLSSLHLVKPVMHGYAKIATHSISRTPFSNRRMTPTLS
jgi:hypothetical protein